MRKLGRILRRCLTALSLLLFVAVLAAWVRGYWRWDFYRAHRESMDETGWYRTDWAFDWGSAEMGVFFDSEYADAKTARAVGKTPGVQQERVFERSPPQRVGRWYARLASIIRLNGGTGWTWDHGGLVLGRMEDRAMDVTGVPGAYHEWSFIAFPCWMAAVVFGALPSWRLAAWWRSRRRRLRALREGRCRGCGYDLRASPVRCPECGLAVPSKDETAQAERL